MKRQWSVASGQWSVLKINAILLLALCLVGASWWGGPLWPPDCWADEGIYTLSGGGGGGGGGGTPGGSNLQLQYNNNGAFGGISLGTAGQFLQSGGTGSPASFAWPTWGQYLTASGPTAARTKTVRDANDTILELGGGTVGTPYAPTGYWDWSAGSPTVTWPTFNQATTASSGSCTGNAATATTATNLAGTTVGSIPYQSASGTTSYIADVAAGSPLLSGGTGTAPAYGALNLAGGSGSITGVLPAANGGAGSASGVLKANGSGTVSACANLSDISYKPMPIIQAASISSGVASTPTITTAGADLIYNLAVGAAITSVPAPSVTGGAIDGQIIRMRFQDGGGGPYAISGFNAIYAAGSTFALPTTTVASLMAEYIFEYNAGKVKWLLVGCPGGF